MEEGYGKSIMKNMKKNIAIILASGSGKRFKFDIPKQFAKVAGRTVLEHTIDIFEKHRKIDEIYVVINPEYYDFFLKLYGFNSWRKVTKVLKGGSTRQESSYIGISACEYQNVNVVIHDAVRPFVTSKIIDDVLDALKNYKAVDTAVPSVNTIIEINDKNEISDVPLRKYLCVGQTPQAFDLQIIKKAHEMAIKENRLNFTDDCGIVLHYNLAKVYIVKGSEINMKVTYPIDIYIADKIYQIKTLDLDTDNETDLKDKVIVIFGGNDGIGKAIAELGKTKGAIVYSFSRKNGCDISSIKAIRNSLSYAYSKKNRIDVVINSAAILKFGKLSNLPYEKMDYLMRVNYNGNLYIAKESYKYLKESHGQLILFTSSSFTRGRPFYSIYSSSKAAVVNLTQALSEEWFSDSIRVNAVCPERTATKMRFENFGYEDPNTLLDPKEVAKKVIVLINSNITGQIIDVRKRNYDAIT